MKTVAIEVAEAAQALQAIALGTCFQYATDVVASAAEAVLADGMPDQL